MLSRYVKSCHILAFAGLQYESRLYLIAGIGTVQACVLSVHIFKTWTKYVLFLCYIENMVHSYVERIFPIIIGPRMVWDSLYASLTCICLAWPILFAY